jgi:hypothetical protein
MATDYLNLGPVPCGESCQQVGMPSYDHAEAMNELRHYKEMLRERFPDAEEYVSFRIKAFPHNLGTYHEVCVVYDYYNAMAIEWAYFIERHLPEKWTDTDVLSLPLSIVDAYDVRKEE